MRSVLRVLGASPLKLFATLMTEGVIVAAIGTGLGIVCGHIFAYSLTGLLGSFEGILIRQDLLHLHFFDMILAGLGICAGCLAALPAAVSAARTDISKLLVKG